MKYYLKNWWDSAEKVIGWKGKVYPRTGCEGPDGK
jgi:hypothetical protein